MVISNITVAVEVAVDDVANLIIDIAAHLSLSLSLNTDADAHTLIINDDRNLQDLFH